MKKLSLAIAALATLLFTTQDAVAFFSVGNTITVKKKSEAKLPIMLTTEYSFTADKNEADDTEAVLAEKITLMNLFDGRVRPYAKIGGVKVDAESSTGQHFDNDKDLIWGLGVDAILTQWANDTATVFGSVGYTSMDIDIDQLADDENELERFHISLGVSKELGAAVVYAGASYWHGEIENIINGTSLGTETTDDLAPFVGVNVQLNPNVSLGLEANLVDNNATFMGSISIQF